MPSLPFRTQSLATRKPTRFDFRPDAAGRAAIAAALGLLDLSKLRLSGEIRPAGRHDFDLVADRFGLPHPPRLPRAQLATKVSPMLLSFMSESRRLKNERMKVELGVRLRWPTVSDLLASLPVPPT
jgi:hypothetical protein